MGGRGQVVHICIVYSRRGLGRGWVTISSSFICSLSCLFFSRAFLISFFSFLVCLLVRFLHMVVLVYIVYICTYIISICIYI